MCLLCLSSVKVRSLQKALKRGYPHIVHWPGMRAKVKWFHQGHAAVVMLAIANTSKKSLQLSNFQVPLSTSTCTRCFCNAFVHNMAVTNKEYLALSNTFKDLFKGIGCGAIITLLLISLGLDGAIIPQAENQEWREGRRCPHVRRISAQVRIK